MSETEKFGYGDDIDFDKQSYDSEKTKTTGKEWLQRVERSRKDEEEYGIESPTDTFGHYYLRVHKNINDKLLSRLHNFQETFDKLSKKIHAQLCELSIKDPYAIRRLIFEHLVNSNLKSVAQALGVTAQELEAKAEQLNYTTEEKLMEAVFGLDNMVPLREIMIEKLKDENGWSEQVLTEVLQNHAKSFEKFETNINNYLETSLPRIKAMVFSAIDSGLIPLDKNVAEERIDSLKIIPLDWLSASINNLSGDYDSTLHVARLTSDLDRDRIDYVLLHEVLHAISGKIEGVHKEKYYEDADSAVVLKNGLVFKPHDEQYDKYDSLMHTTWLNEAVTENLSIILSKRSDSNTYIEERGLIDMLEKLGIPKQLMYEAYFENFDEKSLEHSAPKLAQLFQLTNKVIGQGFLRKLGKFIYDNSDAGIKTSGSAKAYREWQEKGSKFIEEILSIK